MQISLNFNAQEASAADLVLISAFSKTETDSKGKSTTKLQNSHWPKDLKTTFDAIPASEYFTGSNGDSFHFQAVDGRSVLVAGLGEKSKYNFETLRKTMAHVFKGTKNKYGSLAIQLDHFLVKNKLEQTISAIGESLTMTSYEFDRYLSEKKVHKLKEIVLDSKTKKTSLKKAQTALDNSLTVGESINFARDLVNEPPNVLHSEQYAKIIEKDAKDIPGVKVKILNKAALKKEKMGLFLSVNNGSAYEPRLVHLTYTPKKTNSKTKHIALVGKGLTFDTGGYSLKPGGAMINMKFDMAGSATVYAAFRAAAMMGANVKISCFLGMTDNAINSKATMPDSIVKARNGKTVEILNTDAEGRLVLADVLDYACDHNPDAIIDSATLTGACLVALGIEVCGLMSNNKKLADGLTKSAKNTDEYIWELPIIDEFRNDMKSPIADLKNIGGSRFGGSAKAAAFLENFIKNDIPWAHLDIAGVGDSQGGHLPYCPAKGASGVMVRTIVDYLSNVK